jgi:hypothetical protein
MPDNPDGGNRQADPNDHPPPVEPSTTTPPPIANHLPAPSANAPDDENHATKHRTWNTVLQVGLLIVGTVYSFFAYQQWQATAAAVKSADANARLDQRAWVGTVSFEGHPEAGKPFNGRVKIRNTGKTFATDVIMLTNYCGLPKGTADPDFKKVIESDAQERHGGVLVPNADVGTDVKVLDGNILTAEDVKRIDNGDYAIILFGRVSYKDIFNCQHWTTFCFRYEKGDPQPFWYAYGSYNKADKNTCP